MPQPIAKSIEINGVVQGVGFRPFIFGLAHAHGLKGEVSNTARGVSLHVEGPGENMEAFVRDISLKIPPLACIIKMAIADTPVRDCSDFVIRPSRTRGSRATLISPDVSICDQCRREMLDPGDRRYQYPFINCTNCGPRFTIIKDLPYDRPQTSMAEFPMCPDCRAEYEEPRDRRFHAQPNACPVCGPHVWITNARGERMDTGPDQALDMAADLLSRGKIVAVKGLGGFHLACDAANGAVVDELRHRKHRPHKPFGLMARSLDEIGTFAQVSPEEAELLTSLHKPIVLLKKRPGDGNSSKGPGGENTQTILPPNLAPDNAFIGVMLPYTPLHVLLLEKGPPLLVMTSGNRPGEPLSVDNQDALDAFGHIADAFLFHNREIYFGADDSVARPRGEGFIRRSRGYAPHPVLLKGEMPPILACGAGLKNTACLTRGNQAFLTQHIGDLDNTKVHAYFQRSISHLETILEIAPRILVHDLHPDYHATRYAKDRAEKDPGLACIGVQHHHAHALSCMAEHHLLDREVMAVTLDGTGLGSDGHIWGGEILTCTPRGFTRRAHLRYLPLPGGDAAATEPWRMGAALLLETLGRTFPNMDLPWLEALDRPRLDLLVQIMEKKINCPLTSSCGRLFDGVASLLGLCQAISHEGQAAMALEARATREQDRQGGQWPQDLAGPGFAILDGGDGPLVLDPRPWIRHLMDRTAPLTPFGTGVGEPGNDPGEKERDALALDFHLALVDAFSGAAGRIAEVTGIREVVLSGGVFNNDLISRAMAKALGEKGLKSHAHFRVPCGDGGISLGQAVAGAAQGRPVISQ